MEYSDVTSIKNLLGRLRTAAPGTRPPLIAAFEAAEPALFRRLYGDLLTFFYSTPETAERTRQLANAAPREPSPHFDPSLLDTVIRTQAGKRRL